MEQAEVEAAFSAVHVALGLILPDGTQAYLAPPNAVACAEKSPSGEQLFHASNGSLLNRNGERCDRVVHVI